jgi:hypothetical protein
VYFLVTFFSKSYTCVIRLSVIEDLYRSIVVVVTSTFILLAINFVMSYFTGYVVYGYWNILIIGARPIGCHIRGVIRIHFMEGQIKIIKLSPKFAYCPV